MKLKIHLEKHGPRIWMASPWRFDIPSKAKEIPGHNFADSTRYAQWAASVLDVRDPPRGCWTFPLNYQTCLDLRKVFKHEEIIIHPNLWEWAEAEKNKRADLVRLTKLHRVKTPRIAREYPKLNAAIQRRAFQSVGVAYAVRACCSANGDQPGLGKTLQAAGAVIEAGLTGPILVVAPSAAATITWPDEFEEWVPREQYIVAAGNKEERNSTISKFHRWADSRPDKRSWLFINIEMLQEERKPLKQKKGKNATWEDWLGYNLEDVFANHEEVRKQLDLGTIEQPKPKEGSPGHLAEVEFVAAMKEWKRLNHPRRHPELFSIVWSGIIIDEAHKILPTKTSEQDKQSQIRSGAQKLVTRADGLKLALSGTLWRGDPLNMWGVHHWLDPIGFPGFWDHAERWFNVSSNGFGQVVDEVRNDVEEDFAKLLDVTMIRRTKAEVAPWLPPKMYAGTHLDPRDKNSPIGVWLDMVPKQKLAYEQMARNAVAQLDSGDLQALGVLAEITRLKQFACSAGDVTQVLRKVPERDLREWSDTFIAKLPSNKWDWTMEFLDERGITSPSNAWGEGKVVIASWQTGVLNVFRKELANLKIPSLILTGETKNVDRAAAKRQFQAPGGPRVFLLNTFAGGVSLTLDAADDMIILDETWVPDDQEQVEDRIHRISRKEGRAPATYWYPRSRGTIDEMIAANNLTKDLLQKKLLDGRRGVTFAKQILTGGRINGAAAA
jgi:SNF2 family DNA or RNA helicase